MTSEESGRVDASEYLAPAVPIPSPGNGGWVDESDGIELSPGLRADLLDFEAWGEILTTYARTTRVAVALTDAQGHLLGKCYNAQPVWTLVHDAAPGWDAGCPFCLTTRLPCTAVADALQAGGAVMVRDQAGLTHVAVPLSLGKRHLGTIIAGQVFDRYPEPLPLRRVAKEFGVSAQELWDVARKQRPVSSASLQASGDLLCALGQAFLQQRYGAILEAKLAETNGRFRLLVKGVRDYALFTMDLTGHVTSWNGGAESMLGYVEAEIVGQNFSCIFTPEDIQNRVPEKQLNKALQAGRTQDEGWRVRADRKEFWAQVNITTLLEEAGPVRGFAIIMHDVSEARAMTLKMTRLAQHDFLTDLPNRVLLNDRITQAISLSRRYGKHFAVLFLDLDGFKQINDSLGHEIGDKLLKAVAQRAGACVRSSDTVSRHGGDEFVVLLSEIADAGDAALSAEKILTALAMPLSISEHDFRLNASIGISIYPEDGQDADTLIKSADTAMYQAKGNGRGNYRFFEQNMNLRAVARQVLESSLGRALERQEFLLHYQPTVDLETGAITGAEALIRWMDPDRGLIPPVQFVPIAEDCGLIVPIGQWVLHEACRQARAWMDAGLGPIPVAVNISAVEFRAKNFLEGVCGILKDTRLEPRYLELELTESVLMRDDESTTSVLQALKAMGVQLAIDDFGTGYSSLSYLRRFPIDVLKIDQSFVHEISTNTEDAAIVCAVLSMGKTLKKRVIAEGVETREQLAFLRAEHCIEGQGYYFNHPVVAEDFRWAACVGKSDSE